MAGENEAGETDGAEGQRELIGPGTASDRSLHLGDGCAQRVGAVGEVQRLLGHRGARADEKQHQDRGTAHAHTLAEFS